MAWIWEELEGLHQSFAGVVGSGGVADQLDHLVDVVQRDQESLEHVFAGPGAFQFEARPTLHNLDPVVDEVREHLAHAQGLGLAGDQTDRVHAEGRLQGGVFEQLVGDAARE